MHRESKVFFILLNVLVVISLFCKANIGHNYLTDKYPSCFFANFAILVYFFRKTPPFSKAWLHSADARTEATAAAYQLQLHNGAKLHIGGEHIAAMQSLIGQLDKEREHYAFGLEALD